MFFSPIDGTLRASTRAQRDIAAVAARLLLVTGKQGRQGKQSFFEKKYQKTSVLSLPEQPFWLLVLDNAGLTSRHLGALPATRHTLQDTTLTTGGHQSEALVYRFMRNPERTTYRPITLTVS